MDHKSFQQQWSENSIYKQMETMLKQKLIETLLTGETTQVRTGRNFVSTEYCFWQIAYNLLVNNNAIHI